MVRLSKVAAIALFSWLCACSGETELAVTTRGDAGNSAVVDAADGSPNSDVDDAGPEDSDAGSAQRPIAVSDDRTMEAFGFFPEDANPDAVRWYEVPQVARFRRTLLGNQLPVRAKLVVTLNGVGNSAGPTEVAEWLADRGFHTLTLDYRNVSSVRLLPDSVQNDNLPGPIEAYSEIIEGVDYSASPDVVVARPDSVFGRMEAALQYLTSMDPGADWAYYLNADGTVRLTDVIFYGYSFGGATSTVVGKRFSVGKVVAAAAPRFSLAATAEWLAAPSVTPLDHFYAIVGAQDPDFLEILAAIDTLGWPGEVIDTTSVAAPFNESHRLQTDLGHVTMCSAAELDAVCEYAFGIGEAQ